MSDLDIEFVAELPESNQEKMHKLVAQLVEILKEYPGQWACIPEHYIGIDSLIDCLRVQENIEYYSQMPESCIYGDYKYYFRYSEKKQVKSLGFWQRFVRCFLDIT